MKSRAHRRREEEYKRALAKIIEKKTRDKRFELATITDVELSEDFMYAEVYVDVIGSEQEKEASVTKFNDEEGFFRTNLASEINPRYTPELDFKLDRGLERMHRIEEILDRDDQSGEDDQEPEDER